MKRKRFALAATILVLLFGGTASGWNDLGHRVVAQIAWNELDRDTKAEIIRVLKTAPADSRILQGLPLNQSSWPSDVENDFYARLFQSIGTWPDHVRPGNRPRPTDQYHHGDWHYINVFWLGSNRTLTGDPTVGKLIEKLTEFTGANSNENDAVQAAWLVHLIGDVHQPLHCSARITNDFVERDGDRGGNEFCLVQGCRNSQKLNLHSFWDSSLTRNHDLLPNESIFAQAKRLANDIAARFPASGFADTGAFSSSQRWSEEGVQKAIANAYPSSLHRNQIPSKNYRLNTLKVSEDATALAGYRLAATFEAKFGGN